MAQLKFFGSKYGQPKVPSSVPPQYQQYQPQPQPKNPLEQMARTSLQFRGAVAHGFDSYLRGMVGRINPTPAKTIPRPTFMKSIDQGFQQGTQAYNRWVSNQTRTLQGAGTAIQNAQPAQRRQLSFWGNAFTQAHRQAANPNPETRYFNQWAGQSTRPMMRPNNQMNYMYPGGNPFGGNGLTRGQQAYANRLAAQGVAYYNKPVQPLPQNYNWEDYTRPAATGGTGGGWGSWGSWGGGGGGYSEPVKQFWNNMIHWAVRPSGNRGG